MNRKQSSAPCQTIVLSYGGQTAPTPSAKGDAELTGAILAITRDYEVSIYENAELVHLLARLELGDAIPEVLYRIIAETIAFAWHLKGKCPEGFASDATDGNEMLLLGGPGDRADPPGVETEAPEPESARAVPAQSTCHFLDHPCPRQAPSSSPPYYLPPAMSRPPRPSSATRKGMQSPVGTG